MKLAHFYILISFIFLSIPLAAQENFYSEIGAKWRFSLSQEDRWSYTLGSAYRSNFYDSEKPSYNTSFLQFNAVPSFAINSNQAVSLEFRYRIQKLFDNQLTDEKRLIQQYNHNHKPYKLSYKGRLRVEHRFRENFNLRNRYKFGASLPINRSSDELKNWTLTVDTEFLWSIFPKKYPTFDQRFSLILEKPISSEFTFKLKTQYSYLDYTHQGRDVWQVYTSLGISL